MTKKSSLMFSKDEERIYKWFRGIRDPFYKPFVGYFKKKKIKPDTLSWIGMGMLIPFVYFFTFNPWIAFFVLLLILLIDGLDGALARHLKIESARGDFLDHTVDYVVFVVIFFTLLFFKLMDPFLSAMHLLSYAVMQSFIIFAGMKKISVFPVLRPKMFFYLIIFVWLISSWNLFDYFLVITTAYLFITNIFLFFRIRWALS